MSVTVEVLQDLCYSLHRATHPMNQLSPEQMGAVSSVLFHMTAAKTIDQDFYFKCIDILDKYDVPHEVSLEYEG